MCVSSNSKRTGRPPGSGSPSGPPHSIDETSSHAANVAPMMPPGSPNDIRPFHRDSRSPWSIPNVIRFSHAIGLAAALWALGGGTRVPAQTAPGRAPAPTAESMKPYTETIPGTDVKFEMLPIPGGTFEMGSPPGEAKRGEDEGPQHPVRIAPFWMGKLEVTWEEYDQFAFALDLKKKQRENVNLAQQPESEKNADAVTRP